MAVESCAIATGDVLISAPFATAEASTPARWRLRASVGVLVLWCTWLLVAAVVALRQGPARPARPDPALERWLAELATAHGGTALAVRLGGDPDCACTNGAWDGLVAAVRQRRGQALVLAPPAGLAPGVEVAILGGDGRLRYAGALAPDPALCGPRAGERLAAWLPALLVAERPLHLPASTPCAC